MSVSYNAATQTSRMNATLAIIDGHASPATLEIGTAGFAAVLVVIVLDDPSFTIAGTPAVMTMAGVPKSGTASGTGTAAAGRIKDGSGTVILSGLTVGTSGQEITLNSTSISSGQSVTIASGTLTHAP